MSKSLTFYNILNQNIISDKIEKFHDLYLRDFFRKHHINMQTKFKLIQSGGYNVSYKENNSTYSVELYEPEYDKNDPDYEYINKYIYIYKNTEDINSSYCCLLSYSDDISLHIDVLESPIKCIKTTTNQTTNNDTTNYKKGYGDIMMKIIIKIAKKRGFKNIKLEDKSIFNCLNSKNNLKYSLKNVYILQKGYPWYYKYGFRFMFNNEHIDVKNNYKKIKNIKTSYISFRKLIKMIKTNINNGEEVFRDNPIDFSQEIINDIKSIYDQLKDSNICEFFNRITLKYCELMSIIYLNLFEYLNLKYIHGEKMILNL